MIGVFGDLILDIAVKSHGPLQLGSDVTGEISYQGGGSGANCAAWIGSLGGKVRFAGAVGKDLAGQMVGLELKQAGVETFLVRKTQPTGTILLFIDDQGERTMVTSRGANLYFRVEDLSDHFLAGLQHFHITAYSFFGSPDLTQTTRGILQKIQKQGIPFSVDPSSYALLTEFGVQKFLELTKGAQILFPNLEEGRILSGKEDPDAIVRALLQHYPGVVLTLGKEGCVVGEAQRIIHVEGPKVEALDTTGAGDSFAAGFLHTLVQGASLVDAAIFGHSTASHCVRHYGGRPLMD